METQTQTTTASNPSAPAGGSLERVRGLSWTDFIQRYVIPRKPVILEDTTADWAALKKWDANFWSTAYGDRPVEINGKTYPLKEIIRLATEAHSGKPPPYYRNIRLGSEYPELEADIAPYPEVCQPNWFHSPAFKPLRGSVMGYGQYELFIGGAGRSFPYLHFDVPGAHTFIHQLHGRKLFVLYPPGDSAYLYPKTGRDFNVSRIPDVDNVSLQEFPLYAKASRIDEVVGPGDTLFMPFGWWHTARMLSFSVTVGIDVANETNWNNVCQFLDHKAKAKLGPASFLFMSYIRMAGAYLGKTDQLSSHPKR